MAEATTHAPEVLTEARGMGWVPKEEFRGNEAAWVDADQYVERGRTVLPILKKNNQQLQAQLAAAQAETARLAALVSGHQEQFDALDEMHAEEKKRALAEQKTRLRRELALAVKDGDDEAIAQITEEMVEAGVAAAAPAKVKEEKTPPAASTLPPEMVAWQAENPWFGVDQARSQVALGIGVTLRARGLTGAAFYSALDAELTKHGTTRPTPAGGKVEEGGRGGGATGPKGKTYHDLPADAKEACDRFGKKFVGKGKRYEKVSDWQAKYVADFFKDSGN